MSRGWKLVVLFLVLLLPALIFTFLKMFGENKFDVPVQHKEGLNIPGCESKETPHKIPAIDSLSLAQKTLKVVFVATSQSDREILNELRRLSSNHPEVMFIFFFTAVNVPENLNNYIQDNWKLNILKKDDLEELNKCGFGNIDKHSLILTDPERYIRGYYNMYEKKELDRLEGEIKILKG